MSKVNPKKATKKATGKPATKAGASKPATGKKAVVKKVTVKKTAKSKVAESPTTKKGKQAATKSAGVVSRRELATKTGKKGVVRRVPAKKQTSPVVNQVKSLVNQLSAAERTYYVQVRDLAVKRSSEEIMTAYKIGKLLVECKAKFPKSNASETITTACGISEQHGRLYRKMAERFEQKEIEEYVAMRNADTGWSVPLTTLYNIGMRAQTAVQRKNYVKEVINEQMSQETFDQRHPLGVTPNGDTVSVRVLKGAAVLKRGCTSINRTTEAINDLLSEDVQEEMEEGNVMTIKLARELLEGIQEQRPKLDAASVFLEEFIDSASLDGDDGEATAGGDFDDDLAEEPIEDDGED